MYLIFIIISLLLSPSVEQAEVENIYASLLSQYSVSSEGFPKIQLTKRTKNIASFSPSKNTIYIEQKAYDICSTLGNEKKDALAFIIAHELTHYLQKRTIGNEETGDQHLFDHESHAKDQFEKEAEADRFGAFLCYRAGFTYEEVAPKILKALYQTYQLEKEENENYPSFEKRIELTSEVCKTVKRYIKLFEAATALHLIGEYDKSQSIYTYLLQYLDLPEIYNNAGVNQLKAVLARKSFQGYPMNIIFKSSLRDGLSTHPDSLLLSAQINIEKACKMDPSNHESFINLATVLTVQSKTKEALQMIKQLKELTLTEDVQCQLNQLEFLLYSSATFPNCKDEIPKIQLKSEITSPFSTKPTSTKFLIDNSDPFFPFEGEWNKEENQLFLYMSKQTVSINYEKIETMEGLQSKIYRSKELNIFQLDLNEAEVRLTILFGKM